MDFFVENQNTETSRIDSITIQPIVTVKYLLSNNRRKYERFPSLETSICRLRRKQNGRPSVIYTAAAQAYDFYLRCHRKTGQKHTSSQLLKLHSK